MDEHELQAQKEALEADEKHLAIRLDAAVDARDRVQILIDEIQNEQRQVQNQIYELVKELNKLLRAKQGKQ